jgi:hypothetical protein
MNAGRYHEAVGEYTRLREAIDEARGQKAG